MFMQLKMWKYVENVSKNMNLKTLTWAMKSNEKELLKLAEGQKFGDLFLFLEL